MTIHFGVMDNQPNDDFFQFTDLLEDEDEESTRHQRHSRRNNNRKRKPRTQLTISVPNSEENGGGISSNGHEVEDDLDDYDEDEDEYEEEDQEEEYVEEDDEEEQQQQPYGSRLRSSPSLDALSKVASMLDLSFDTDFGHIDLFSPLDSVKNIFSALEGEKAIPNKVKQKLLAEKNKLKENYEKRKAELRNNYEQRKIQLRAKGKELQDRITAEMKKPTFIRTKDKIGFTLGVINTVMTAFLLGKAPQFIPAWYTFWCLSLLGLRFFMYHREHYHYFMLDFCYFSNLLLLFYLHFYPTSSFLFSLCYVNSNGPLLWAIVTWRNSLVFHDLDKVTSVFIHAFPPIVTYVIRWYPIDNGRYAVCSDQFGNCESSTLSLWDIYLPHIVFFIYWQVTYILKTEYIDKAHLNKHSDLQTSFRWLQTKNKRSAHYKVVNAYGERYQVLIYVLVQFAFHMVTIIPMKLMWDHFWLNTIIGVGVFAWAIWNGANYYIERFSKDAATKYQLLIHDIVKLKEINREIGGIQDQMKHIISSDDVISPIKQQQEAQAAAASSSSTSPLVDGPSSNNSNNSNENDANDSNGNRNGVNVAPPYQRR